MMVSANDAAYAIAETVGGSISGFAADLNATAQPLRDARQHVRRSGRPHRRHVVRRRPEGRARTTSRSRPATRSPCPRSRKWADTRTYDFTDPSGVHHALDQPQQVPARQRLRLRGRQRLQDRLHRGRRPHAGRDRQAQRAPVHRRDPRIGPTAATRGRRRCSTSAGRSRRSRPPARRLPPVAVSPYADARRRRRPAFTKLAVGSTGAALAARRRAPRRRRPRRPRPRPRPRRAAAGTTPPPGADRTTTGASTPRDRPPTSRHDRARRAAHHSAAACSRRPGSRSCSSLLLAVCVVLRRRAVKRQRARRIARQRARAKAMRSGSLPVVDGRYRTGTRVGPPVESHVRVEAQLHRPHRGRRPVEPTAAERPTSSA